MKRFLTVILAASLCATLMSSCGQKEDTSNISVPIRTGNSINYDTATAYRGTILEQVTLDGSISAPYTVDLSFTKTGGTIASIDVHNDQEVHEGDVIATLSDTALEDEIVVQELTMNAALRTYENLQNQHASSSDIEFAKIDYDIEKYKYDKLVEKREFLTLRAPFDGRIVSIDEHYRVGSTIKQYDTFCTVSDSSKVCLTASDFGGALSNVSFGTRVDITQGVIVSTTGKVVDTITSEIRNRDGNVFTMTSYVIQTDEDVEFSELGGIQVVFTTLRRDDAVIVPSNAVFEATEMYGESTGSTSSYVNVLMKGIKVQTAVIVGVISGDKTEILSGLEGGETIILP